MSRSVSKKSSAQPTARPMAVMMAAPTALLRRWPLSTPALACIVAFFALHILGGRYAYSNVPYDDWARAVTGTGLSDAFGWTRNHYDRLVHFALGGLGGVPVAEISRRWGGLPPRGATLAVLAWDAAREEGITRAAMAQ